MIVERLTEGDGLVNRALRSEDCEEGSREFCDIEVVCVKSCSNHAFVANRVKDARHRISPLHSTKIGRSWPINPTDDNHDLQVALFCQYNKAVGV